MTQDEFAEAIKDGTVLVDYWAEWCPGCSALTPVLDELAEEHGLKVVKVNVDENPELAVAAGIRSIPMIHLFEGGQKVQEVVGSQSKQRLERKLLL